jgi:hypothetical protein
LRLYTFYMIFIVTIIHQIFIALIKRGQKIIIRVFWQESLHVGGTSLAQLYPHKCKKFLSIFHFYAINNDWWVSVVVKLCCIMFIVYNGHANYNHCKLTITLPGLQRRDRVHREPGPQGRDVWGFLAHGVRTWRHAARHGHAPRGEGEGTSHRYRFLNNNPILSGYLSVTASVSLAYLLSDSAEISA